MKSLIQNGEVAKSTIHGFGVFAKREIRKGETIEECPYIVSDPEEKNPERIQSYLFSGPTKRTTLILLGYGCVYNHSKNNNADYYSNDKKKVIVFYATRKIMKGEEIFSNYGKAYWKTRGIVPKH
jgi:SET domain-containing protein